MDSAVSAAWAAREQGFELVTLAVDYGQRHRAELAASKVISDWLEAAEHVVLGIDLRPVGGSALTTDAEIPKPDAPAEGIPVTYVPARNTILLSLALGLAEARGAGAIVIGVNRIDYSGYPDCRPEFLEAFQRVAGLGTRVGVTGGVPRVLAPLVDLSKAAIVELGLRLGVPFEKTISCYDAGPDGGACGACDACRLRREGFLAAGVRDPTRYA
jgi:7-cyano-7-deazaguanine synthase